MSAVLRQMWAAFRRRHRAGRAPDAALAAGLAARMEEAGDPALGPGLGVLHVDCGSCTGCEIELRLALSGLHDAGRHGIALTDGPRQADALLVTGPVTRNTQDALGRAWDGAPDPKYVIAMGDCAVDGGVFRGSYAVAGGAGSTLPVDLAIRGCPPSPGQILEGLRTLEAATARRGNRT